MASWENSPGGFKAPDPSCAVGRVLRGDQFGSQGPVLCRERAAGDVELVGDVQGLVGFVLAEPWESAEAAHGASLAPAGFRDGTLWWK